MCVISIRLVTCRSIVELVIACVVGSPRNRTKLLIIDANHCVFLVSPAVIVVVALALLSSWTETMMYATRTRFAVSTAVSAEAVVSPGKSCHMRKLS